MLCASHGHSDVNPLNYFFDTSLTEQRKLAAGCLTVFVGQFALAELADVLRLDDQLRHVAVAAQLDAHARVMVLQ